MTRKHLHEWYSNGDITYNEKSILNKMGVDDYDYHTLQDFKQMLRCENWAKGNGEIWNKFPGKINRIVFFTPNFNDSKPDASNYSCAIVTDGNNDSWVIVYHPSYSGEIGTNILVKKVSISASEVERKLNGSNPILAIEPTSGLGLSNDYITRPYVYKKTLPSDAKYNPDKYILPLDIVTRFREGGEFSHYAIYLGNKGVAELPGRESTKFVAWDNFCNPSSSSSSSGSGSTTISLIHPQIPFKRKHDIIRHMAKTISHGYGGCDCHFYNPGVNNYEHLANGCVLGINNSSQGDFSPLVFADLLDPIRTFRNIETSVSNNTPIYSMVGSSTLKLKIVSSSNRFDNLTSSYSYEKGRIEEYIRQAENNRYYKRSKYQIEQEKFEERVIIYPKDWCRIS